MTKGDRHDRAARELLLKVREFDFINDVYILSDEEALGLILSALAAETGRGTPTTDETIATVRDVARKHGYSVGVHGSLKRDLDLMAVPWTDGADDPETLVEAIRVAVGGIIRNEPDAQVGDYVRRNPCPKPHGRLAWSIHALIDVPHRYIDLSVMPRLRPPHPDERAADEGSDECDECDGSGVYFIDDEPVACICLAENSAVARLLRSLARPAATKDCVCGHAWSQHATDLEGPSFCEACGCLCDDFVAETKGETP